MRRTCLMALHRVPTASRGQDAATSRGTCTSAARSRPTPRWLKVWESSPAGPQQGKKIQCRCVHLAPTRCPSKNRTGPRCFKEGLRMQSCRGDSAGHKKSSFHHCQLQNQDNLRQVRCLLSAETTSAYQPFPAYLIASTYIS